jgi:hypothetical protein
MRFIDPFREICCPFCNQPFKPGHASVVSRINPGKPLRAAPQGRLQRLKSQFLDKPPEEYKREFASRACPHCGTVLPPNMEQVDENLTIAIIGDTFSGKSHYIAALIDQLKRVQLPERFFSVLPADPEIEERYHSLFYRPLFKNQQQMLPTRQVVSMINEPLIYQIDFGETADRPRRRINLLIYDASGEELATQITLMKYKSHILNARAIIFLADPWAMPNFVDRLAHNLRPDSAAVTGRISSQVLASVVQTFQFHNSELAAANEFPLPIAITLSKADLIEYLPVIGPKYKFLADLANQRIPNASDTEIIDEWVRKLLGDIKEDQLLGITRGFRSAKFFAISATSSSASKGKYNSVKPHRCLDPLFWIFRELDILD